MPMYYVATLARYVLVSASSEEEAQTLGRAALADLDPDVPINIRTVREATADEIELWNWHQEMLNREPKP